MADVDALLDEKSESNEEESGANKWEPKIGDKLSGYLTKTGWYDGGEYEPSMWLLIKDEEGDTHRVYCPTVLRNQVVEEAPAIGSGIALRYEGKVPTQNNPKRSYHKHTFVLVPDKEGKFHTDAKYWNQHGEYRGNAQSESPTDDSEDSFF